MLLDPEAESSMQQTAWAWHQLMLGTFHVVVLSSIPSNLMSAIQISDYEMISAMLVTFSWSPPCSSVKPLLPRGLEN